MILLFAWILFPSCGDNDDRCGRLCAKLNACGFLPSALGADSDNCESRCVSSQEDLPNELDACIDGQDPDWPELAGGASSDSTGQPRGCASIARCLDRAGSGLKGFGRVMLVPSNGGMPAEGARSEHDCSGLIDIKTAAAICEGWGVSHVTAILDDGSKRPRSSEGSCVAMLTHQPTWDRVAVGILRAELVIEGRVEADGAGGAPASDNPTSGGESGAGTLGNGGAPGSAGAGDTHRAEPAPCWVFPAPLQVNHAGPECVGIVLPFSNDKASAIACERGAVCTDNVDNDGDGWTDCEDPKCQTECRTFMSVTPNAHGGAATE